MNLPSDFILRTRELLGDAEFAALAEALGAAQVHAVQKITAS